MSLDPEVSSHTLLESRLILQTALPFQRAHPLHHCPFRQCVDIPGHILLGAIVTERFGHLSGHHGLCSHGPHGL